MIFVRFQRSLFKKIWSRLGVPNVDLPRETNPGGIRGFGLRNRPRARMTGLSRPTVPLKKVQDKRPRFGATGAGSHSRRSRPSRKTLIAERSASRKGAPLRRGGAYPFAPAPFCYSHHRDGRVRWVMRAFPLVSSEQVL